MWCAHALQVQLWSRLGRLKRSNFPKMTGGGHTFGGGAAPGLMSVLAGRLLCDTYLSGALACRVLLLIRVMLVIVCWSSRNKDAWKDSCSAAVCSLGVCWLQAGGCAHGARGLFLTDFSVAGMLWCCSA